MKFLGYNEQCRTVIVELPRHQEQALISLAGALNRLQGRRAPLTPIDYDYMFRFLEQLANTVALIDGRVDPAFEISVRRDIEVGVVKR